MCSVWVLGSACVRACACVSVHVRVYVCMCVCMCVCACVMMMMKMKMRPELKHSDCLEPMELALRAAILLLLLLLHTFTDAIYDYNVAAWQ